MQHIAGMALLTVTTLSQWAATRADRKFVIALCMQPQENGDV
jgi:hypothetical protein